MSDKSYLEWPFFEDHHRQLATDLDTWASATPVSYTHLTLPTICSV